MKEDQQSSPLRERELAGSILGRESAASPLILRLRISMVFYVRNIIHRISSSSKRIHRFSHSGREPKGSPHLGKESANSPLLERESAGFPLLDKEWTGSTP